MHIIDGDLTGRAHPRAMPTRVLRLPVLLLAALLAGCGLFEDDDRAPWRAQAEAACFARGMVKLSPVIRVSDEIDGKGACGLDRPLRVHALADGTVRIGEARGLTMSCPVTAALERWVAEVVQPAAVAVYGAPVVELKSMGTYNCRTRNSRRGARLSEHAFANAIDVSGFVFANGHSVSVLKGWRGGEQDRLFLRAATAGACGPFTTVLGPGSDGLHENHLHLDLARHNAQGTYLYCKPKLEMPPLPKMSPAPMIMVDNRLPPSDLPPPGMAEPWPRTLPQPQPAAGPLPPASVPMPAPVPVAAGPQSIEDLIRTAPPVPGCPPGYVCLPTPAAPPAPPPPVGWQVGPQPAIVYDNGIPLGYADE